MSDKIYYLKKIGIIKCQFCGKMKKPEQRINKYTCNDCKKDLNYKEGY